MDQEGSDCSLEIDDLVPWQVYVASQVEVDLDSEVLPHSSISGESMVHLHMALLATSVLEHEDLSY